MRVQNVNGQILQQKCSKPSFGIKFALPTEVMRETVSNVEKAMSRRGF